ncbi:hypothetical protein KL86DYS1_10105 [uncultured Dysgonomonas sp.]|uniref:Uncharacterized protein n=1 Tax=uncultured Dysgonomonas sp. TaxID=206096 RepID=A0A212ITM2_9BACT|nr:hypothetical protein KL86DYS1_10105 [uncultured Dysgonomonas sp.]
MTCKVYTSYPRLYVSLDHKKIYAALFVNDTLGLLLNRITIYNHDIYNCLCDLVVDNFDPNFYGYRELSDVERRRLKVASFIKFRNDRERKISLLITEFKKQLELSL